MKKGIDTSAELAELRKIASNKRCFDCNQAGTTYAIPELGIFLCSICGGIHREFNHRVKGLSTCNFTEAEVNKLKSIGNEKAALSWMARHDPRTFPVPELKDATKLKDFLRLKYLDKRFYENRETVPSEPVRVEEKKQEKPVSTGFINLLEDEPVNSTAKIQKPAVDNQPPANFFPGAFAPGPSNGTSGFPTQLFPVPSVPSTGSVSYPSPSPSVPVQSFPSPISSLPAPPGFSFPSAPSPAAPSPPQNVSPYPQSGLSGFASIPNPSPVPQPPNLSSLPAVNTPLAPGPSSFTNFANFPPVSNPSPGFPVNPSYSYPPAMQSGFSPSFQPTPSFPQFPNNFSQFPPGYSQPSLSPGAQQNFFGKAMDPFEQIAEEERKNKLLAQQARTHVTPAQQLLMQQYNVQAQLYQNTYGVPYPYTFQQWANLNSQPVSHEPRPHSKNPFDLFG